ncbi:MAG: GerMN domain-containing protein [Treponema sp.]|nr:GerMN domain-containing protein [Treponema sp.]
MAEKKNKTSNKKNTGFAFACWLLIALILLVFFFVKRDTIVSNLKNTDFFNRVFGKTPEFVQKHENKTVPEEDNSDSSIIQIDTKPAKTAEQSQKTDTIPETDTEQEKEAEPQTPQEPVKQEEVKTGQKAQDKKAGVENKSDTGKKDEIKPVVIPSVNVQLCFVLIDSDGSVSRQIASRSIPKSDSPLSDAIKALLAGPTINEKAKNCMTLIPSGTKLLSANVKNGIATLNFSEEFEYNPVGVEGYIGQLMQIVYTATSFSTVNSVQFIVEGQREEYLGSEGEWIGSPLSRSSFR